MRRSLVVALLLLMVSATQAVPRVYERVGQRYGIAPQLLYDTALVVSGKRTAPQSLTPWPWTLHRNGQRLFYPHRVAAEAALRSALQEGQNVRVGLLAIEPRTRLSGIQQPTDLLTPSVNLRLAAERLAPYLSARGDADHRVTVSAVQPLIARLAPQYGLDPLLVQSVAGQESGFDPRARSRQGARGLMQLMPGTAQRFGVRNVWAVEDNLHGGLQYLQWLSRYYHGDVVKVLAAYNAGEGAVDQYGGVPPYPETRTYVARILKRYAQARQQLMLAEHRS